MSSVEIASTATEPVRLLWLADGGPVTGSAPTMRVRRKSDVFSTVLDWDAELFTADAVAVTPSVPLAEVSATYAPGLYWWLYDPTFPSNAVAPDIYAITFYADATLATPLGTAEVRVGTVDTLDALPATLASAHGAGSWLTASGFATSTALATAQSSLDAIQGAGFTAGTDDLHAARTLVAALPATLAGAHGAGSWATATGFATAADVAASTAAIEAYGQSHWVTADISTLATAASLAAVAVDATKARRALWNRRTLSSAGLFTLYADDATTTLATATITDKDGAAITLQTGEAARSTALV